MSSHAQSMLRTLRQIRRRAFRVLAVSYVSVGVLYSLLGLAVCGTVGITIAARPPASAVPLLMVLVLCSALITAALRAPSLKQTAKLADRTYQLHQRCETALEFITHRDEFSLLLHRDACRYLDRIDPVQLLPYRISVGPKTLLLVVLTGWGLAAGIRFTASPHRGLDMSVLLARSHTRGQRQAQETTPRTVSTSARMAPQHQRNVATARRPRTADGSRSTFPPPVAEHTPVNTAVATSAAASPPAGRQPNNHARIDNAPEDDQAKSLSAVHKSKSKTDVGTSQPSTSLSRAQKTRADIITTQTRDATNSQTDVPTRQGSRGEQRATTRATRDQPEAVVKPLRAPGESGPRRRKTGVYMKVHEDFEAPSNAVIPSAAGFCNSFSGATVAVKDASTASQPVAVPASGAHDSPSLNRRHRMSEQYWNAAEEVLAKEQIPPGFRKYIRDYFVAIHPDRGEAWRP